MSENRARGQQATDEASGPAVAETTYADDAAPDDTTGPAQEDAPADAPHNGEGLTDLEPFAPSEPGSSLHAYHEWHLQRLQRRMRLVTWALAALGVLVLAALTLLTMPGNQTRTTSDASAVTERLANDTERLDEAVESLESARSRDEASIASIRTSLERMEASLRRIDTRLAGAAQCIDRSLSEFDEDMRALLERRLSPEAFVRRPALGRCRLSNDD